MAVIRWNPASDLINLHSELDRIFGDLTEGRSLPAFLPVDIERGEKELTIRASVPGFKPEEVNITVDRGVLTIDARKDEEREEKDREGKNVVRRERFSGRLYRQIALGEGVDSEKVQARFENGELTITVPLAQRPEPRRIPVQSAGGTQQPQTQQSQDAGATGQQQELVGASQSGS